MTQTTTTVHDGGRDQDFLAPAPRLPGGGVGGGRGGAPGPPARMMPFMLPPLPGASSCGSRITNNYPYVTIFLHICGPTHANGTQYPHWWCADRIVSLWIVTSVRYPRT